MKRYLAFVLMTAMLLSSLVIPPASAAQPGEAIGNVLYSDVVAYIDGYPIRSYNINGYTYIIAEDLASYGFHVEWRGDEGKLIIHTARTAVPAKYTANYKPEKNTHTVGAIAFPYLHTNITTWIGQNQVTGYNVGGSTCICMDDLANHFGKSYVWNPEDVTLRLSTTSDATQTSASTPEPKQVGQVTGEITYKYNNFIGHRGDTGATVILVDRDIWAVTDLPDSLGLGIIHNLPDGVYATTVSGSGHYNFSNIPEGEYYIVIISNNTNENSDFVFGSTSWGMPWFMFSDKGQEYALLTAQVHKTRSDSITVYGGQTTYFSYDFGVTWIAI